MPCCVKPLARIIKVGDFEAGLTGLDEAFQNVLTAEIVNEDELGRTLLSRVKKSGNYIAPSREGEYKTALVREYRAFKESIKDKQIPGISKQPGRS